MLEDAIPLVLLLPGVELVALPELLLPVLADLLLLLLPALAEALLLLLLLLLALAEVLLL